MFYREIVWFYRLGLHQKFFNGGFDIKARYCRIPAYLMPYSGLRFLSIMENCHVRKTHHTYYLDALF